jgi:hypothetical protein
MDKKYTTLGIVAVCLVAILSIIFMPQELVDQFGLLIFVAPILVIIGVVVVVFLFAKKKSFLEELQAQRQKINFELKEAEKQFLQRKIDKVTFDNISQARNTELIQLEAEIDFQKKKDLPRDDVKKLDSLGADKRKVLFGLLEQKQLKVHELKLAENSLYKRRITEETYQNISNSIKADIISIEAQIKAIWASEEIIKLKDQLRQGAKEIAKQKKSSAQRSKEDFMDEMEEDLVQQLSTAS